MNMNSNDRPITKVNDVDAEKGNAAATPTSLSPDFPDINDSDLSANPEVFIGLVSPVGTDLQDVIKSLGESFKVFGYEVVHIKITDIFSDLANKVNYKYLYNYKKRDRIKEYIYFGNELRRNYENDFLSKVAITSIINWRHNIRLGKTKYSKVAYIIDQLKTMEELSLLKSTYKEAFFQMSVYSARDIRVDHLSKKMAELDNKRDSNSYRAYAENLVNKDENERKKYGQKVGKIFQLADVVINVDRASNQPVSGQVDRFVKLLFGSNALSPNHLEYGMYMAHSAALRSLDLSRQVGAAIFLKTGEIATLGANEVPKAGGGTYWSDGEFDAREYTLSRDSNDVRKTELLNEVVEILHHKSPNSDLIKSLLGNKEFLKGVENTLSNVGETAKGKEILKEITEILNSSLDLSSDKKKLLDDTQFMDALEYGRIVHAEMSALSDAARLGISVQDGKLYCTTFPCHMCSKHIVASGISEVVFLEPYPKSLTPDLHSDSVKVEGASRGKYSSFPAVKFIPFYGVTPTRYKEFFYRQKRKENGRFIEFRNNQPQLMFAPIPTPFYVKNEGLEASSVEIALCVPIQVDEDARKDID